LTATSKQQGFFGRLGAPVRALWQAILGKSSYDYQNRLAGGDEYWDNMLAAQEGWGSSGLEHRSAGRDGRK
jgi:hypothetical protein